MQKLFQCCAILFLSLFLLNGLAYSANEQFRSIATGNWNANPTWEMSNDGGSTWIPATSIPSDTSGLITVRSPNTVTVTASVSADQLIVNNGATLFINAAVLLTILNGSGDDLLVMAGGTVSGAGTVQTQGVATMLLIRTGSTFKAALKVNTGTTTVADSDYPNDARIYGNVTVDIGATLNTGGNAALYLSIYGNLTNNGTLTGTGNLDFFGPALTNSGSITSTLFSFDSTSTVSGLGTYTGVTIRISARGNVSLLNNVTFSLTTAFLIKTGGMFSANTRTLTITSGEFEILSGGTVVNSGIIRTQNTIALKAKTGSKFNAALNVNTGTTTATDPDYPNDARIYGNVTVDNGATLNTGNNAALYLSIYGNLTNNGTLTGTGNLDFFGPALANGGSITSTLFSFDSTSTVSGLGTYTGVTIRISARGNVSLLNNVTFSLTTAFLIKTGGMFSANTRTLTITSGEFEILSGGTVVNSGIIRTQNTIALKPKTGSNFNAALNVNTGTTTATDPDYPNDARIYGNVTVDNGATLNTGNNAALYLSIYGNLTNNGTLTGTGNLDFFGPALANGGSITSTLFSFDSTSTVSGLGTYTGVTIRISARGNVSLLNNVTFSLTTAFLIKTGGIFSANTRTLTITSGEFEILSGGTVVNSGIIRTQNNIALKPKTGSNFNAALNVNTGTTTVTDPDYPNDARIYGNITVDIGATLNTGGHPALSLGIHGNIVNNGTITGTGSLQFRSGSHTLQGTGNWTTPANILNGATLTLASIHQMYSVNINLGGTFNISNFILKLTATDPITQQGTFIVTNSTVEYNGAVAQTISTISITYHRLKINNSLGTSLSGYVIVNDTLSVILGDLNLNGNELTLSPTGYLTETPGNTVKGTSGYIYTMRNINAPSALNVAGLGAVLTTNANLGNTVIKRGHTVQTGLYGGTSIERYFDITPNNNGGLDATLTFKYDDSELNGKPETSLKLYRSTDEGIRWALAGGSPNASSNTITLMNINSFSRWTADSSSVSMALTIIMEGFYNTITNSLNMRDTVRAYLRNTSSPFAIVDSAKAVIDMTTLTGAYNFPNATSGTYYIQVKHRNSIETWSKTGGENYSVGSTLNYNFTTAAAKAFGDNMKQVDLSPIRFGIYSGDVNQDGVIDGSDAALIDNDAANFATGYRVTDLNGDQVIDGSDASIVDNNAANFVSKITP